VTRFSVEMVAEFSLVDSNIEG